MYRDVQPWGFILFGRNILDPDQVRKLTDDLRATVGRADAPVLIDQEGGRVARLRPPHWPRYPAGAGYARLADADPKAADEMAWLGGRLIAHDLFALESNVDCAPVLDTPQPGAHDVIGDRAFRGDAGADRPPGRPVRGGAWRRRRGPGDQAYPGPWPGHG